MKLYLARHGEYLTTDIERRDALSEAGIRHIEALAERLKPLHLQVGHISHSGKLRAQQTAEILAHAFVCDHPSQAISGINPYDDVREYAHTLESLEHDTLVVGHLPFIGRLVGQLVIGNEDKELIDFQTGTLVCLEAIDSGRWIIRWVLTADIVQQPQE